MKNYIKSSSLFYFLILVICFSCTSKTGITEKEAIISLRKEYEKSWLENDSLKIMETLTIDAVLIPHHGDIPIVGVKAIKDFWWPAKFSPSKVTIFESTYNDVGYENKLGFISGRFKLGFNYEGKKYYDEGNYLNIVEKRNGKWKLSRLIWNDPLPEIN
ncbi:nuclear transport factor 2 family protein [Psychroserpens algicola]|uniref:Nuclear transport factor 2 family protein n=1 Tax=Psychroserpens algicola TaxID=1719034 RepID=A0ABT0H5Z8_9FLAO|nr:nuclear transport factor 2 family protein [Psychroserpens algicola]MCK8479807.1 nuclear transport factor 2 family protein [Psychroserpens algicola]